MERTGLLTPWRCLERLRPGVADGNTSCRRRRGTAPAQQLVACGRSAARRRATEKRTLPGARSLSLTSRRTQRSFRLATSECFRLADGSARVGVPAAQTAG